MAIAHGSGAYGFYFMVSWLPLYLVKARGFSLAEMGTILGAVYLVFAASAASGGWLTDRWIGRGATQGQARKTAATVAHLLSASGLLITAFAPREAVLIGLFMGAIGQGIVNPHTFATPQVLAGRRATAKWLGVQNCLGNFSSIIGPLITGAIIDHTGGFQGAFVVTAGVLVVGLTGWLALIPRVEPIAWKSAGALN
jgi:cyanate permease